MTLACITGEDVLAVIGGFAVIGFVVALAVGLVNQFVNRENNHK